MNNKDREEERERERERKRERERELVSIFTSLPPLFFFFNLLSLF